MVQGSLFKSQIARYGLIAGVALLSAMGAGCASNDEEPTTSTTAAETTVTVPKAEAPAIVKDKCSLCHGLKDTSGQDITPAGKGEGGQPALKGQSFPASPRADWTATIERMRNQNKCEMTDDEAAEVIKYLNENYGS